MDEEVKVYTPAIRHFDNLSGFGSEKKEKKPKPKLHKNGGKHSGPNNSKWKFIWFDKETLKQTINEKAAEVHELEKKYPWYDILYNWVCALLVVVLFVSFGIWGVDIHTRRQSELFAATALADYQAEQEAVAAEEQAKIEAEQKSEQAIMAREATAAAKAIYGIRNFIEKYGYGERDLRTYVRCMCDRVDFGGKVNSFESIVSQEAQFLAYSDNNPVLDEYYKIAMQEIEAWHHETSRPWDSKYRFAELTESGIFLTDEFGADGYARRVRY